MRWLWVVLVLWWGPAWAGDLAAMNRATVQAFVAGDLVGAVRAGEAALLQPGGAADRAEALNSMGYLLLVQGQDARAAALVAQAMALAEAAGLRGQLTWLLALQTRITLAQRGGDAALGLIDSYVVAGRASPYAADVMGQAADMLFRAGQYPAMAAALDEMLARGGTLRAAVTLDDLYAAQGVAEAAGRIEDASALIDARITLVRALQPDMVAAFAHGALWTKFYMNERAGLYGPAADALRDWAATGQMSEDERAFIQAQASNGVLYAELASYGAGRVVQLGNAELALAYAELLPDPFDLRRARALRALALAEAGLGRLEAAGARLQDALAVAEGATGGAELRFLVREDLAANAWARGDGGQAQALYGAADAAYGVALAAGMEPLTRIDRAIGLQNRARLAVGLGDEGAARGYLVEAWALFRADQVGAQKANVRALEASLLITEAGIGAMTGQGQAEARQAVAVARGIWPQDHPDMAVLLGQAADVLARAGDLAGGMGYLQQADGINAVTLPADAPPALEIKQALAQVALLRGDRVAALQALRAAAEGRKGAADRAVLAEGADGFQMLVWALLDQPEPEVEAAFAALQWTQITGSAAALAGLQAQLAASSPERGSLIARAQDVQLQSARLRSDLMAAYAAGVDPAPLRAREAGLAEAVAQAGQALAAAGLEMSGLAPVAPVTLAEVQALLGPDEVLVSFVLPGLRADVVPGLAGSSNFALAVSREGVRVARIAEGSRGALNARIAAFRCQIALGEPGCAAGSGGQRGAMVLDAGPLAGFDEGRALDLYRDLFGGIEPALQGKAHLIIVPPADLLRLPFQALMTGEGDWLIRRHAVSVLPSVPSFATLRRSDAPGAGRMLGVGDPVLSPAPPADCAALGLEVPRAMPPGLASLRALPALPDASCELRAIAGGYGAGATLLLQGEAQEGRIKAMNAGGGLRGFDLMVFATHGLLAGEAGSVEPALVMTPPVQASAADDGLLTASEIASLSLAARLVILSACNTAAGEGPGGDGLSGLARAFFQAGARALLVTHWSVYSRAATLVSTGYVARARAEPALRPAEVLRQVLLGLVDSADPAERDPSFWAAFTMVGAD